MRTLYVIPFLLAVEMSPIYSSGAWGQGETTPLPESEVLGEGIEGIIIDHTITFIGREFYIDFAQAWSEVGLGRNGYNLTVREQPTSVSGSRVWVEFNRRNMFETFLSPATVTTEEAAEVAAKSIAKKLRDLEIQKHLFVDPDLAPDEI